MMGEEWGEKNGFIAREFKIYILAQPPILKEADTSDPPISSFSGDMNLGAG